MPSHKLLLDRICDDFVVWVLFDVYQLIELFICDRWNSWLKRNAMFVCMYRLICVTVLIVVIVDHKLRWWFIWMKFRIHVLPLYALLSSLNKSNKWDISSFTITVWRNVFLSCLCCHRYRHRHHSLSSFVSFVTLRNSHAVCAVVCFHSLRHFFYDSFIFSYSANWFLYSFTTVLRLQVDSKFRNSF